MNEGKEQKLAAARRKLRKYRKKKGEEAAKPTSGSDIVNVVRREVSSKPSSIADVMDFINQNDCLSESSKQNELLEGSPSANTDFVNNGSTIPHVDIMTNRLVENLSDKLDEEATLLASCKAREVNKNGFVETDAISENDIESSLSNETISMVTVIDASIPLNGITAKSTSENLHQLSLQMSGLINDGENLDPSGLELNILELEKRNSDLAASLADEKQTSTQQNQMLEELRTSLSLQDAQIQALQNMALLGSSTSEEVSSLRERLQMHIQTIGILVAEKSELHSSLDEVRHKFEQKSGEVSVIQEERDASQTRIRELEASIHKLELQLLTESNSKEINSEQLIGLQLEYEKISNLCDELRTSVAELTERLSIKSDENQKLQTDMTGLKRELNMAHIHIEQLRYNAHEDLEAQIEQLKGDMKASEKQVWAMKKAESEKSSLEENYKLYVHQLTDDSELLKDKVRCLEERCSELQTYKNNFEEKLRTEELNTSHCSPSDFEIEKTELLESIKRLEEENCKMSEKCFSLENDNKQLCHLLSEQTSRLESLEASAVKNVPNPHDTHQLLQSLQSSKVAAARALTQNKQLKEQLGELQDGLILMSNKKLELTEKLERELHRQKALHLDLASHKDEILRLKEEVAANFRYGRVNEPEDHTILASEPVSPQNQTEDICDSNGWPISLEDVAQGNSEKHLEDGYHEALEERFAKCMRDLAAVSDEKQNLEHLVQQLQLETDTVGDYITIYQFQRGVMKQRMQDLTAELDILKTEKEVMVAKLSKLQKLFTSLNSHSGVLTGIQSIFTDSDSISSSSKGHEEDQVESTPVEDKTAETMKQIGNLLNEMEASNQFDISVLHKLHICSHCSGKLLTV